MATKRTDLLARVRRICAALPETEESSRLGGEPHFYVRGKIFCGCGVEDGVACTGMKVGLDLQALLIQRPGFRVAKYVGKHGWITVEEHALADDAELERLIHTSYELIRGGMRAPKATATARPSRGPTATAAARTRASTTPRRGQAKPAPAKRPRGRRAR